MEEAEGGEGEGRGKEGSRADGGRWRERSLEDVGDLPLMKILGLLPDTDRIRAERVSRTFRRISRASWVNDDAFCIDKLLDRLICPLTDPETVGIWKRRAAFSTEIKTVNFSCGEYRLSFGLISCSSCGHEDFYYHVMAAAWNFLLSHGPLSVQKLVLANAIKPTARQLQRLQNALSPHHSLREMEIGPLYLTHNHDSPSLLYSATFGIFGDGPETPESYGKALEALLASSRNLESLKMNVKLLPQNFLSVLPSSLHTLSLEWEEWRWTLPPTVPVTELPAVRKLRTYQVGEDGAASGLGGHIPVEELMKRFPRAEKVDVQVERVAELACLHSHPVQELYARATGIREKFFSREVDPSYPPSYEALASLESLTKPQTAFRLSITHLSLPVDLTKASRDQEDAWVSFLSNFPHLFAFKNEARVAFWEELFRLCPNIGWMGTYLIAFRRGINTGNERMDLLERPIFLKKMKELVVMSKSCHEDPLGWLKPPPTTLARLYSYIHYQHKMRKTQALPSKLHITWVYDESTRISDRDAEIIKEYFTFPWLTISQKSCFSLNRC